MKTKQRQTAPDDAQRWAIRIRDVSQRSGLSESEVRRAIYAGELPARKYRDRLWLIDVEEAKEWIDRMCGPSAA